LRVFGESKALSKSYIGIRVWTRKVFGQFWIVRHTMTRHVECGDVARVSQCTLHSAIHDGGRYILPLAFELAGTEYGWDLNSIIHRWMSTCKRENVTTLKADPSIVEYMILPLWWKGTEK